jgi:hypothetical protein
MEVLDRLLQEKPINPLPREVDKKSKVSIPFCLCQVFISRDSDHWIAYLEERIFGEKTVVFESMPNSIHSSSTTICNAFSVSFQWSKGELALDIGAESYPHDFTNSVAMK